MAVTYSSFIADYPVFATLSQSRYNSFLAKILPEINQVSWGNLKDLATEMLLGHFLSVSGGATGTAGNTANVIERLDTEATGDYTVTYGKSEGDYTSTWFGREYARLLKLVTQETPVTRPLTINNSYVINRTDPHPQVW